VKLAACFEEMRYEWKRMQESRMVLTERHYIPEDRIYQKTKVIQTNSITYR
jgi:hypothetical protein